MTPIGKASLLLTRFTANDGAVNGPILTDRALMRWGDKLTVNKIKKQSF